MQMRTQIAGFLILLVFLLPGVSSAQQSCEIAVSPELAKKFAEASEINKKAIALELRRVCGDNVSSSCAESTLAELFKTFDKKNFYSMNPKYLGEEQGIAIKGREYKTRYLRTDEEKAPYLAEVKDGRIVSKATGQPFDPWDPKEGPRSENWAKLMKQEKMGSEEAIFVINKKNDLLLNPEAKRGTFHHSSFEAGEPVLVPGQMDLTHDGRLQGLDTCSGHYQAGQEMLDVAIANLRGRGLDLKEKSRRFDSRTKCWRVDFL
jgi:hypothetical protein